MRKEKRGGAKCARRRRRSGTKEDREMLEWSTRVQDRVREGEEKGEMVKRPLSSLGWEDQETAIFKCKLRVGGRISLDVERNACNLE